MKPKEEIMGSSSLETMCQKQGDKTDLELPPEAESGGGGRAAFTLWDLVLSPGR